MKNKDKIVKCINSRKGVSSKMLMDLFRLIASESLMRCMPTGLKGLEELDKQMLGDDEELTESVLLDSISILTSRESGVINVSTDSGSMIAKITNGNCTVSKVPLDELQMTMYSDAEGAIEGSKEKAEGISSKLSEALQDDYYEKKEAEGKKEKTEDTSEKDEEPEENEDSKKKLSRAEEDKKLLAYYSVYTSGILSELLKRYKGLFSSGYEVEKPTGILSERGILKLSGSSMVVDYPTAATSQLYKIFRDQFGLKEVAVRSVSNIADNVCKEFLAGSSSTLYFPNKMLEFAYGRKAPGNNAESTNTYEKHAESGSWEGYSNKELKVSLNALIEGCLLYYLYSFIEEDKRTDEGTVAVVSKLLEYLQRCISMCLLLMDYRVVNGSPSVLKIRVCDPNNALGKEDITPYLLEKAFMGATGAVPFSYAPRFEEESFVKEYAHEFNHDISQAMPLFAYKAYEALKRQGIKINWDNIVLGKFEDGSVLRNGTHGVTMKNNLTHHIDAGSRAGKGVMTLAMLGAGIATEKVIFYLDRKPDMASLLKHLSPNMFVVNGASFDSQHDNYGMFKDVSLANVPKEVTEILKCGTNWSDLGDLVYMRALKLVMGIILARGSGAYKDVNLGGSNGILLIVDEFKNFQESFSVIVRQMMNVLPVSLSCYNSKKEALGTAMNDFYNRTGLYAVSYLNHLIADLEFLSTKRDAGFATRESELSDIFVIGQHLEHGMLPYEDYANAIVDGRYQTPTKVGLKSEAKNKLDISKQSFGYSLVSFKTADAFFGRNREDGREVYLAQADKRSKAYGRLDDKASNFAYLKNFSESVRKKIVEGKLQDNLSIANSCVYFKPFLVLNDTTPEFVNPMYSRCAGDEGEPWVTKEEIIAENPDYAEDPNAVNATVLNRRVGFEEYLRGIGAGNYPQILERSSDVANYVVQNLLGYEGTWYDFITDLRPMWMFTIEDIVLASNGKQPTFRDPAKSRVLSEYYAFDESLGCGVRSEDVQEEGINSFFMDNGEGEDFSDMSKQEEDADKRLAVAMGDYDSYEDDEDIPLWDDMSDDIKESPEEPEMVLKQGNVQETGFGGMAMDTESDVSEIIKKYIDALKGYGVDVQVGMNGWEATNINTGEPIPGGYSSAPDAEFGQDLADVDYQGDVESLDKMVEVISNNILKTFGGLERIHSFKAIGGAIIINGYYYRCRVQDMYAKNIPYDIRRDINAGSISKLFDYSLLRRMKHIRDLEFDSTSFTYDYVSSALGYGSSISVDKFFHDFKTLQVLTIGREKFNRANYMEKISGNDLFYLPRRSKIYADAVEQALGRRNHAVWDWTKRSMVNKKDRWYKKVAKVSVGATASAATYLGSKGVGIGKKVPGAVKDIASGVKDLFR